jgi:hypothetical protein
MFRPGRLRDGGATLAPLFREEAFVAGEVTQPGATDAVESLILDLLEWIGREPRPYAETQEAWRTSCPRLPVWEEANERGFISRSHEPGRGALVSVSAAGGELLREHRRPPADRADDP